MKRAHELAQRWTVEIEQSLRLIPAVLAALYAYDEDQDLVHIHLGLVYGQRDVTLFMIHSLIYATFRDLGPKVRVTFVPVGVADLRGLVAKLAACLPDAGR